MKKIIAWALVLAMCVAMFASCTDGDPSDTDTNDTNAGVVEEKSGLDAAYAYIKTVYKEVAEVTGTDYQVIGSVPVGTEKYTVTWTADVSEDLVSIVVEENGMVTINVNEETPEEVKYVLTATLTDGETTKTLSWNHTIPAYVDISKLTPAEIVDLAYALEDGVVTEETFTLTGVISKIDTAWSDDYQNITVSIKVEGKEDKPIMCYRLKGEGAKDLAVGDTITVEGVFKNYKGTIEFDAGCTLTSVVKGEGVEPEAPVVDNSVIDEAYALEENTSLTYSCTLTGVISTIDTAWSEQYQNITVTIVVEGYEDKPIMCFRLKGEGANALVVGDTITVTGTLKNYNGIIEFDAGCTLDAVVSGGGELVVAPEDPAEIVDAAYALDTDASLPYEATLTGTVTSIDTPYSPDYNNITVTIAVEGKEDKPIVCFRLKGEGADALAVGDVITVTGTLMNYAGTVEYTSGCTFVKPEPKSSRYARGGGTLTPAEIVEIAYALETGGSTTESYTLVGEITKINTPYSTSYNNITVTIVVEGKEEYPIQCYRLAGEGADGLAVGDTITVTGKFSNYKGTVQYAQGSTLDSVVKGESEVPVAPEDPKEIVDEAYALESGESLPYNATLKGEITKINTAYSSQFNNITVTIVVEGKETKPIMCYRLKGEGADTIAVGDTITVTGTIKNYNGTIEFDTGCTLDAVEKAVVEEPVVAPEDPAEIVKEAFELEAGESLPYDATLTGEIVKVDTPYSESYKNITVTILVEGKEIQCYRLKGEGADGLAVGDTITVTGEIKNYNGTIEFNVPVLEAVEKGENEAPVAPETPEEIIDAAYALEEGESLPYNATLTGKIVSVDTAYNAQYKNVTVTIAVEGKEDQPIVCFRLKGEGADRIKVGDVITVSGQLMNYGGVVEFNSGCTLISAPQTGVAAAILSVVAVLSGAYIVSKKRH